MANWEVTKTKRYNKPIEEHTAKTKGGAYKIEVPEGSRSGVLYRFDDLRGFERIASGDIASLKQQAESMGKKESRGVAGIERLANMSRPGAKDMMATRNPKAREKWETVFYEYFDGVPVSIMDSAKIKNDINAILASGADLKVEMPKLVKKYGRFSRPGAKAKFKVEDRFYFGKGRKERFAEIDVVNQLMQLAMKEGMADRMKPEIDRVLGSGSFDKLFKSYKSALISKRIMELKRQGKSTPEAFDLVLGAGAYKNMVGELYDALRAKAGAKHSRPGKPERFAEPREIEAKIRAWIDSRGLPIGLQETNALSYIAAQNMLRGGVSIQQAVKSAARRHAQIGLASAGLRTWLEENS